MSVKVDIAPAHDRELVIARLVERLRRGVAALCIGGGEATAMAVELV